MQYQLNIKFDDDRADVSMQAQNERGAFDMFASMSRMSGVKEIYMAGIATAAGVNTQSQQQQPQQHQHQHEYANSREEPPPNADEGGDYRADAPSQSIMELRPPPPAPTQSTPVQQQQQSSETPRWLKDMKALADTLPDPPRQHEPRRQQQHQEQEPYRQVPEYRDDSGKSPLEQHSSHLEFGFGEAKRFKRSVPTPLSASSGRVPPVQVPRYPPRPQDLHQQQQAVPPPQYMQVPIALQPPPQRYQQPQQQQQQQQQQWATPAQRPQQQVLPLANQQQHAPQREAVVFAPETSGFQGGQRPFSKGDADMLNKATQMLHASVQSPNANNTPTSAASLIMQQVVPHLVNVDWRDQIAYRDDFARVMVTCQRILTGQPYAEGQGGGNGGTATTTTAQ